MPFTAPRAEEHLKPSRDSKSDQMSANRNKCCAVIALVATLVAAATAQAAEINAFISTAVKSATDEILPPFERSSGFTINALYSPPGALLRHFAAGEPADIFVTGKEAIDTLIGEGKIAPARIDLAKTGIGICVRKGAPHPDVSTPEAFKNTLLAAGSVAYVAPAGRTAESA